MTDTQSSSVPAPSHFPAHDGPRVWILSSGDSPIGVSLARQLLQHGDYVVAGARAPNPDREDPRTADFQAFLEEVNENSEDGQKDRLKAVALDVRLLSSCQAAVATAISSFGRVDVLLCCTSQTIVGSVEELASSERTRTLITDQFETNYLGPVNMVKAALVQMRKQKSGHILSLGGITGHIGTPGLGVYCAAGWALEGYCDVWAPDDELCSTLYYVDTSLKKGDIQQSLAYEVAPFNIKVTIVQCSIEILILTNLITSVPPILPAYSPSTNPAPLFRGMLNGILQQLPAVEGSCPSPDTSPVSCMSSSSPGSGRPEDTVDDSDTHQPLSAPYVVSLYPPLSHVHLDTMTEETVHAITAIGGHTNPPARHIVGSEGIASVKEKLKTVSEELEDFTACSCAVDIYNDEDAVRQVNDDNIAHASS